MLPSMTAFAAGQFKTESEAMQNCPAGTAVWLNTSSGKVHHKDSKWYGRTKTGAYTCAPATTTANSPTESTKQGRQQWIALAKIDAFNGGATLYIDLTSVQRHTHNAEMNVLMDFKQPQEAAGMKFLSSELHKEYNCSNGQWRILSSTVFEQDMGKGRVIQSDSEPDDWKFATPESIARTEWEKACAK